MNRKYLIITILILLIFSTPFTFANKNIRYYYDNISEAKEGLNEHLDQIPGLIEGALKRDRIELKVKSTNEDYSFYIERMKDGSYNVSKEEIEKTNVWISAKEEKINEILESNSPIDKIKESIKNKDLEIKSKGLFRKIKYWFAKLFLKIF